MDLVLRLLSFLLEFAFISFSCSYAFLVLHLHLIHSATKINLCRRHAAHSMCNTMIIMFISTQNLASYPGTRGLALLANQDPFQRAACFKLITRLLLNTVRAGLPCRLLNTGPSCKHCRLLNTGPSCKDSSTPDRLAKTQAPWALHQVASAHASSAPYASIIGRGRLFANIQIQDDPLLALMKPKTNCSTNYRQYRWRPPT